MGFTKIRMTTIVGVLLACSLVSLLVIRTSHSLFSSTTSNGSNSWATGSVTIGDDDTGSALFTTAGDGTLTGGSTVTKCITVTYTGTITSGVSVKLYGAASGALAPYLDVVVEQGTGGGFGNCTGFSGSSIYSGTLQNLSDNVDDFASGIGTWSPSANPQSRVFRIAVTVQNVAEHRASRRPVRLPGKPRANLPCSAPDY